jgi:alanine racemase
VVATVDLDAIRHNVAALLGVAGGAALMAVVKADAYGHGAVAVARAAVEAGATWLGVATVEEGAALRAAGLSAPILLLAEPVPEAASAVVGARLTPTVYREDWIGALADAAAAAATPDRLAVHLKVDTGMHRAGCDPEDAVALAKAVQARAELRLEGLMTHLAVADEPGHPHTAEQLDCFQAVRRALAAEGFEPPVVHAANSAATIDVADARFDLVRVGIALYGLPPAPLLASRVALRPALALRARVSQVRRVPAGHAVSYGQRYRLRSDATIAVVPVGYADGVPRRLGAVGGEVLVGGRRRPLAGTVTMDQIMVDCGDDAVAVGDEVVLIGRQGDEEITATEWAERLDTIAYEIVAGIGGRVPREHVG